MKRYITDGKLAIIIVVAILVIDQIIKILVKTNMALDDSIHIADWFYIRFIENNGMAYEITEMATNLKRLNASLLKKVIPYAIPLFSMNLM